MMPLMGGTESSQMHGDRKLNGGCQGLGARGELGVKCLMGVGFQSTRQKELQGQWW